MHWQVSIQANTQSKILIFMFSTQIWIIQTFHHSHLAPLKLHNRKNVNFTTSTKEKGQARGETRWIPCSSQWAQQRELKCFSPAEEVLPPKSPCKPILWSLLNLVRRSRNPLRLNQNWYLFSPECPDAMDWSEYYPAFTVKHKNVEIADIGCGYGGLLFALSPRFPDTLILGIFPPLSLRNSPHLTFTRHGTSHFSDRICSRKNKSTTPPGQRLLHQHESRSLPKYRLPPSKHNEIHAKLLHQISTLKNIPLFPRSALQSQETQGQNRFCDAGGWVCVCDEDGRYSV